MTLIALFTAAEAALFAARHSTSRMSERQRLLAGSTPDVRSLPIVDRYLRRRTANATRFQILAASAAAQVCRRAVRTRTFEYMLLHFIRRTAFTVRRRMSSPTLEVGL